MAQIIDQGTYKETAVPKGEGVLYIAENQKYNSAFIISKDRQEELLNIIPKSIVVDDNAQLDIAFLILEDIDIELNIEVNIVGSNALVNLSGIYILSSNENVKINILMHHRNSNCESYQSFKGIVSGEAKFNFNGKIIVAPTASGTEAHQENHNISLSSKAKVDTLPQLEIYVDDVKCSHGATIGKLDTNEQFYMRSRGIPEKQVQLLQIYSFLSPVIDKFKGLEFYNAPKIELREIIEEEIHKLLS